MTQDSQNTKLDQLTALLNDGLWHSGEELSEVIGWRFGAVIKRAREQGTQIETRKVGRRWEYRLSKALTTVRTSDAYDSAERLLGRITVNPQIFNGKPIIRGRRLAVEHILGMLAAGDTIETLLEGYPWLEREDVLACLAYAYRLVAHERVEPLLVETQQ
jgi:uncharacterized protein (DUF433 family)/biotin operon repressor